MKLLLQRSFQFALTLAVSLGIVHLSYAQHIGPNVFLKGEYIEVGIASNQQFGSGAPPPTGYHPRGGGGGYAGCLGFVADPALDGWAAGTPNYIGCYFLPGYPQEGWDMSINGVWARAYAGDWGGGTPGFVVTGGSLAASGSNTGYFIEGSRKIGVWEGQIGDLEIISKTSFDTNQVFFVIDVFVKNVGSATATNVYYSRTLDPDNESSVPGGGGAVTTNVIEFQPDLGTGDYRALVSATGLNFPSLSYLGIGAVDCRALVYIYPSGLNPSVGPHNIDGSSFQTGQGFTNSTDCAVGIVFNLGDIEPGDSTMFTYSYILSSDDLDTAFGSLTAGWNIDGTVYSDATSDTFNYIVCRGADSLSVEIAGGGAYIWGEWSPNTGLAYPSGRSNRIAMPAGPTTYRVIGTTPVCPVSDTVYLTITPVGDTTDVNVEICAGSVYDFDGDILYNPGVYFKTYTTAMTGCDSVTKLTLAVNPLPGVDIKVDNNNICEGDNALFQVGDPTANTSYQWLRDGAVIPGATGNAYVATVDGVYRVVGVTNKGCVDTSRGITLSTNPAAIADIQNLELGNICIGDTIELSVNDYPNQEYYWSPDKSFRYITGSRLPTVKGVMHEAENVIEVMAVNQYGCKDTDQIIVYAVPCCDVYLPTAFTPNGDGKNDYFNILLQPGQKLVSFQIFDRTGKMVYDNNDVSNGWNGRITNTGDEVAQAVYFYRIVYSCTDGRNYEAKGDITVVR